MFILSGIYFSGTNNIKFVRNLAAKGDRLLSSEILKAIEFKQFDMILLCVPFKFSFRLKSGELNQQVAKDNWYIFMFYIKHSF